MGKEVAKEGKKAGKKGAKKVKKGSQIENFVKMRLQD